MKSKIRLIYIFTLAIFCLTLLEPEVESDSILEYYRLKSYYHWLTPEIFYNINMQVEYYGVSTDEICAIIQSESEGDRFAISKVGARGLMQIMPVHHKGNKKDLFNVNLNIKYGVNYYSECLLLAKGNKKKTLMYYNAGPFIKEENYKNHKYVRKIISDTASSTKVKNKYLVIR